MALATLSVLTHAGEKSMMLLYGGSLTMGTKLDEMRFNVFQRKVSSATKAVGPEDIPPTSAACKFHSFRAYAQVFFCYNHIKLIFINRYLFVS